MKPYQLNIPTKVYYGRNIWREAIRELGETLYGTVMVVTTGGSLARLGYLEHLKQEIQRSTKAETVIIFDKIHANPDLCEVKAGIEIGRRKKVGAVIGFGGGSAVDAAKAIAAFIREEKAIEDAFDNGREPESMPLPLIAIPTTAGTGSELSKAAILTDRQRKIKRGIRGTALYPKAAIVDSVFTESVPFRVTVETGFDVLAHGIETYLSRAASPYTKLQSERAIQIVGECLPALTENLHNTEAREKMAFASMLMGVNLGNASTCLPHRMQYPLGAHTDTSHGAGLAALFPAWVDYESCYVSEDMGRAITFLIGEEIYGRTACVQAIVRFIKRLGLPSSLQELGVNRDWLELMAKEVEGNLKQDPAVQGEDKRFLFQLYQSAWDFG